MNMWSVNVMILLLFCYARVSTSKVNVYFVSKNFFNVLHWDNINYQSQNILYSVRYRRLGEEQQAPRHCQNITVQHCDLTEFTPSLPDVHYIAQVWANGHLHGSTLRFKPLAETVFSSPNLTIHTRRSELHVNVTLPLGPNGASIADIITKSKSGFPKVVFRYELIIHDPEWAAHETRNTNGQFNITLKSNQKYCGYVNYRPSYEWGRKPSENADFCVTLQGEAPKVLQWILIGVVLLAAFTAVAAVCMYKYIKVGKLRSIPPSLMTFPQNKDEPQYPDRNLIISELEINSKSEKPILVSSPGADGYSPQGIPCLSWVGNSGSFEDTGLFRPASDPETTPGNSSQSSEIYGAVAVRIPNAEEEEEIQQADDQPPMAVSDGCPQLDNKLSPNSTSHGVPLLTNHCTVNNNSGNQINLQTFLDSNGALVLSPLTFQSQSSAGNAAEGKLLLSDLLHSDGELGLETLKSSQSSEWSDSGCDDSAFNTPTDLNCNTNCFPTTPFSPSVHMEGQSRLPDNGKPDYKANWIPSDNANHAQAEDCGLIHPWPWDGHRTEREDEEHEGTNEEEDLTQILLRGWKLQLQE